jgi:PAS domain S-box-containing protein
MSEYLVQGVVTDVRRSAGVTQLEIGSRCFHLLETDQLAALSRGKFVRLMVLDAPGNPGHPEPPEVRILQIRGYNPTFLGPQVATPFLALAAGLLLAVLLTAAGPAFLLPVLLIAVVHLFLMGRKLRAYQRFAVLCTEAGEELGARKRGVDFDVPLSVSLDGATAALPPAELLEFTHDAIIIWELGGKGVVYWNRAAEQLYGYEREKAVGCVTHELLQTELDGTVSDLESTLGRYGVWVGELSHRCADGRRVQVQARLALIAQEKRPWLVLEVNRDITDQRMAEKMSHEVREHLAQLRSRRPTE